MRIQAHSLVHGGRPSARRTRFRRCLLATPMRRARQSVRPANPRRSTMVSTTVRAGGEIQNRAWASVAATGSGTMCLAEESASRAGSNKYQIGRRGPASVPGAGAAQMVIARRARPRLWWQPKDRDPEKEICWESHCGSGVLHRSSVGPSLSLATALPSMHGWQDSRRGSTAWLLPLRR